mgnify:CR=1 FL=1
MVVQFQRVILTSARIDTSQVAILAMNPKFGWDPSMIQWLTDFSLLDLFFPSRDPSKARGLDKLFWPE